MLLAVALLLPLTLALPAAAAEEDCATREEALGPARAWTVHGCEGSVFVGASLSFPLGRAEMQWERDEPANYTSFAVVLPPRYASWYQDEHGCVLELGVVGAMRERCPLGPPAPPRVLLP